MTMFQHPALQGVKTAVKQMNTPGAGRPVTPLIKRSTDRLAAGFDPLPNTPAPIQAAMDKYIKSATLPPGLAPKNPFPLEKMRANNISKGWKHPGTVAHG